MGEAQSGPVWGSGPRYIPCHLLHTLLKPLSPSQPHVLSGALAASLAAPWQAPLLGSHWAYS